jgi:acetyl esterase/lipase
MGHRARHCILLLALAVAFALGGQRAAADGVRYRDEVFDSATTARDIAYGQAIDEHGQLETLYLDLYEPAGDTEPLRPAFVWIHGGGFTGGDKADALNAEIATRFAKRGYVTTSINYRLREGDYFDVGDPRLPQVMAEAQHDAQAAVRWLRANAAAYHIDADRIAVGGTSAGAITALHVNYNSTDPGNSGNPGYPSDTSACIDVSGAIDVTLMEQGEPPVMIVHGTEDARVPYEYALNIVARGQEVGVTVEFHPLEGMGHGVWTQYKEPIILLMADFLYRYASPIRPIGGVANHPQSEPNAATTGGSSSTRNAAAIAGVVAGGALLVVAGVWGVRRRRGRILGR